MIGRSDAAYERALALDPNLIYAASQLVTNRVERGETTNAFAEASALVKRRPDNAQVHFALGYVLRFAGLLDESAQECNTALNLQPSNYQFRSCALAFIQLNQPHKAMEFVRLDGTSEWAARSTAYILLQSARYSSRVACSSTLAENF